MVKGYVTNSSPRGVNVEDERSCALAGIREKQNVASSSSPDLGSRRTPDLTRPVSPVRQPGYRVVSRPDPQLCDAALADGLPLSRMGGYMFRRSRGKLLR
jgi:hypothetical protein